MSRTTTADDVLEQLCVSTSSRRALERWRAERPTVADHVLNHITRVPYAVDSAAIAQVSRSTEHALGEVSKADGEGVASINDWNPEFAFTHVLHYALEEFGEPFTFQGLRQFCSEDAKAREMLWDPAHEKVAAVTESAGPEMARAAMRWRIGKVYYSFLRELYVLAELRERGVDLEVHPLADALFRADAWSGTTVVSLYLRNGRYRDGREGRKRSTASLLGPSFDVVEISMPTLRMFGRVHLPAAPALDAAARDIKRSVDR